MLNCQKKTKTKNFPKVLTAVLLCCVFLIGSLMGPVSQATAASQTPIMGQSVVTKEQMIEYFENNNSERSYDYVSQFVSIIIKEANLEGVRPDIAFTLMMKETNFLKFTGTVKESQNNFGGLGVTGPGVQGESFDTPLVGVRAIIQHLQAYASKLPLKQPLVDPRYQLVERGSAQFVEWLGIKENPTGKGWASDPGYGYDIVNRVNQMKAMLPMRMCVDTPKDGNTVKGSTSISGWAINMSGISKVEIFEGARLLGTAALNVSHPSVNDAFPGYPRANSGYSYALDTTKLSAGLHILKVQATGGNGYVQSLSIQVRVDNAPKMCVDTPKNGDTIEGSVPISGWALSMSSISKVQIYEGSNLLGTAALNVSHPSVNDVFPGYPRNNSGYLYNLDTTKLLNGTHTLAVVATGIDGTTTTSSLKVTINNQSPKMCVDTPQNASTIRGLAPIVGWALNVSGISKVEIFEGSGLLGTAALSVSHPSVNVVYPGYPRENSGYSYALDTTKLAAGLHNLKVQVTGKNGVVQALSIQVSVDNAPKMCVDTPKNGDTIKGLTPISGWALNISGISKVQIYEGSNLLGMAALNVSHPSVDVVFPGYPRNNSGYSYTLDTNILPNGTHTLAVVATGVDGITTRSSFNVTTNNQPMRMCVDTPKYGSTISGLAPISGWALNMSGIAKAEIFEGSTLLGTAGLNVSHPSVNEVFPGYPRENSGYSYTLDTTKLPAGPHTLKVLVTGKNGEAQSLSIQVKVDNAPKMCVDTPKDGSAIRGLTAISGWALNMSGISKVEIFKGSHLLGTAGLNVSHPSVNEVFPGYPRENSGYSYTLDTTKLSAGLHTLRVLATAKNGEVQFLTIQVSVNNGVLFTTSQYGTSGLGRPLYVTAMEVPKPTKKVLITFGIHGYEDGYARDGQVLVNMGNAAISYFKAHPNELKTTSLYVVSVANPDGLIDGWTNNGPGRTQVSMGVDVNRDFDYYWIRMTNARNKTLAPFSSPESKALRSLVLSIRPTDVIDIHGWENTTIGSPELCKYFQQSVGLGYKGSLIGAPGYFSSWATMYAERTALIELANPSTSPDTIINALKALCNS